MKTYKIGRSAEKADIVLPNMGTQVSSVHLELVDMEDGQYYLNDLSSNGTFILDANNQWVKIKQTYVTLNTQLQLANYPTTIQAIVQAIATKMTQSVTKQSKSTSTPTQPTENTNESQNEGIYNGKIERNPETGEIIRR